MNKNILKFSIILILVYSFTLPSFVYANPLPLPVIEFGTQFFQLFSLVLLFLIAGLGTFFKFLKVRFSAIRHKKVVLLGIAILFAIISYGGVYFWLLTDFWGLLFLYTTLVFLAITIVLLLKIFDVKFSSGKYIKNTLLTIASLLIAVFFIIAYLFFVELVGFEPWMFLLSYASFLLFAGLFIKFFKGRFCAVKHRKIALLGSVFLLAVISLIGTSMLIFLGISIINLFLEFV